MISTLLLQASTTPQPTPYAVYATLAVGVLSLIASGLNIYFSSKTAQKVVSLSTKTTREVAELSAQVSRESAGLAAETARELKAKEYRNDFNKKILEKRLNAWVTAEQLLLPLRASVYLSSIDDKERFGFFQSENSFKKLRTSLDDNLVSQLFWLGEDYGTQLIIFINTMRSITKRCRRIGEIGEDGTNVLDLTMLLQEGADAHNVLMESYDKMFTSLSFILSDLHDIDTFLEKKRQDLF